MSDVSVDPKIRESLFRTLAWFETIGYAPTRVELLLNVEHGSLSIEHQNQTIDTLNASGELIEASGRIGFADSGPAIITKIRERDLWQPRKRRRARRVAQWLSWLPGVRLVALANTTAMGYARDEGDLDFFVITRAGTIWQSRLCASLPFRLLGMTPHGPNDRDAVCLSYFVADDTLDLSPHMLPGGDPYFRYWFLSLLPLYDDGVSAEFWQANEKIREYHPNAMPWILNPSISVRRGSFRFPCGRFMESAARWLQTKWFPSQIRERMNRDTTVIVSDQALKFHVRDGREVYRATYREACAKRGIPLMTNDQHPTLSNEQRTTKQEPGTGIWFNIAWRVAIMVLPWQTRWFASGVLLGGWPWEQGRWSVYASWIPMAVVIVLSALDSSGRRKTGEHSWMSWRPVLGLVAISIISIFFNSDSTMRFPAIAQWWIQVAMLCGFGWALRRAEVRSDQLVFWFVLSLLPHIAFGFVQFATQQVVGSSWLGIAAQDPRNLGVSVVEAGEFRALRAYGGFPHPNVFGGWLALGLISSAWLAGQALTKRHALWWIGSTAVIAMALLLTFARGAWIAAAAGCAILVWRTVRSREQATRQFVFVALAAAAISVGMVGIAQRPFLSARLSATERLEQKSLNVRTESLRDGLALFRLRPLVGSGPNAELIDLVRLKLKPGSEKLIAPAEPPHDAYLLALADVGILGMFVLGYLLWRILPLRRGGWRGELIVCLAILALFDHYLWSLWSGQALVLIAFVLVLAPQRQMPAEDSTA